MKFDVGFYCFLIVSFVAVAVASLRTRTIDIGYKLATLKKEEEKYRTENRQLILKLEKIKKDIRIQALKETGNYRMPFLSEVETKNQNSL